MEKKKTIQQFDKSKIELMKIIRNQIKQLRKNIVMLQSGNGGELTEIMDNIAFEARSSNSRLDELLERTIDFYRIYK